MSYLLHRLPCGFPRNEALGHTDGRGHLLLRGRQEAELWHEKKTRRFAISLFQGHHRVSRWPCTCLKYVIQSGLHCGIISYGVTR